MTFIWFFCCIFFFKSSPTLSLSFSLTHTHTQSPSGSTSGLCLKKLNITTSSYRIIINRLDRKVNPSLIPREIFSRFQDGWHCLPFHCLFLRWRWTTDLFDSPSPITLFPLRTLAACTRSRHLAGSACSGITAPASWCCSTLPPIMHPCQLEACAVSFQNKHLSAFHCIYTSCHHMKTCCPNSSIALTWSIMGSDILRRQEPFGLIRRLALPRILTQRHPYWSADNI